MMLNAGQVAAGFTLRNQDNEEISLSDFKGKKVVLYFYPRDNTPGCTTEACSFRDVYDDILELGAVVVGVSPDSEKSHGKFRDRHSLPFHLLADVDHKVSVIYGAWGEKKMFGKISLGIKRITYLIDESGIIQKTWPKVSPSKHSDEILSALKA